MRDLQHQIRPYRGHHLSDNDALVALVAIRQMEMNHFGRLVYLDPREIEDRKKKHSGTSVELYADAAR